MIRLNLIFILCIGALFATGFDTLTYHQKFTTAVDNYKKQRYNLSQSQFRNILANDRSYRDPAAQLMMAKAQYQMDNFEEALRSLRSIFTNYPLSPYESDALVLSGDLALKQGNATSAFKYYMKARPEIEDKLYLNVIDKRIYHSISIGLDESIVEGILFKERNNFNREIINLAKAYNAWTKGDFYELEMIISQINTFQLPGYFSGLFGTLKSAVSSQLTKPLTIAVLLPLTGKNKEKGQAYLLGLSDLIESNPDLISIRLLIYDTKGSAIEVSHIMEKLKSNSAIVAVLGPLTNDAVLSIVALDPPFPILVPKSSYPGISDISEDLFFLTPSPETIARRTAQIIIEELKIENIAVLSPGEGKSKLYTDFFIDECYQLGNDPVAIEWYIGKPENLSRQLKNIRRVAWKLVPSDDQKDNDLNLEIDSLDALFDVDVTDFFELPPEDIDLMDKKDSAKVLLETIQAIYIPINPEELTYIGTQLPFYNFSTLIFGNENWLNMPLLNQEVIGPHVNGMYVVSDVNSAISNGVQDSFSNYYTLAFDHLSFIQSIRNQGIFNRKQFKEKLRSNNQYLGNHTSIKFSGRNKNENGVVQILRYLNTRLKKDGIYDGKTLMRPDE